MEEQGEKQQSNSAATAVNAAAEADISIPHPMRNLHEKRAVLQSIPNDWLSNHNVPKRFQNVEGYCKEADGFYRLSILGCTFQKCTNDLDPIHENHVLDCCHGGCEAKVRVYNRATNFTEAPNGHEIRMEPVDVELLHKHTCDFVQYQATVLTYLDMLRVHLLRNEKNELKSHTGFQIFEKGVGPRGTLNPPTGIFDHFFWWIADPATDPFWYCNNGLHLTCGVNKKNPCGAVVDIMLRNIYTCEVVGKSGVKSKEMPGCSEYECQLFDEIRSVNKPCSNPIYMNKSGIHVLSNGLRSIIPKLDDYIDACCWTKGYKEHNLMTEAELESKNFSE